MVRYLLVLRLVKARPDRDLNMALYCRAEFQLPRRVMFVDLRRSWRHLQHRLSQDVIETAINEDQAILLAQRAIEAAMSFTRNSSHFKNVGEVRIAVEFNC